MKRHLFPTILAGLFATVTLGDIIPDDSHYVSREVLITNINAFPQIAIIGYATGPMGGFPPYVVEQGKPLNKGYKFNQFALFAIRKDLLADAGGVQALDVASIAVRYPVARVVDPGGRYVSNAYSLDSESFYYEIAVATAAEVTLKLVRHAQRFRDGREDLIVRY